MNEYNIGNDEINTVEDLNTQFVSRLPGYRVSVSGRKAENIYLKSLIKSGMLIIKEQISRMMTRYESTKPNFYAAYLNATKVVNYGTRHDKSEDPGKPE